MSPILLLALTGCASKAHRIDVLLAEHDYDQAVALADYETEHLDAIGRAMLADLDLQVAMEPVPAEAFGTLPRGYGESWVLMGVGQRHSAAAERTILSVTLDGWTQCSSCDTAWMVAQMAPPPLEGSEPQVAITVHKGTGLFGGLRLFAELGRVIVGLVALPVTALLDTAMLPTTARRDSAFRPYGMTKLVWDATLGPGTTDRWSTTTPSYTVSDPAPTGLLCEGDLPCSSLMVFRGTGTPTRAHVTVTAERSVVVALGTVDLALRGDTVSEALANAFPSEGRTLTLTPMAPPSEGAP